MRVVGIDIINKRRKTTFFKVISVAYLLFLLLGVELS
jgi:hypothetical protein